jgi:hypothetical protein
VIPCAKVASVNENGVRRFMFVLYVGFYQTESRRIGQVEELEERRQAKDEKNENTLPSAVVAYHNQAQGGKQGVRLGTHLLQCVEIAVGK